MPFLRVTRDERGYEHTSLLHITDQGERPRVLYWYRTAPGVRIGRLALDEEAIRTIESQHPEIAFDWSLILETAALAPPEPERRQERPRRRPRPRDEERPASAAPPSSTRMPVQRGQEDVESESPGAIDDRELPDAGDVPPAVIEVLEDEGLADHPVVSPDPGAPVDAVARSAYERRAPNPLVDGLVGREIAARLRGRFAELVGSIARVGDPSRREALMSRAAALDPDAWQTAEQVLAGVQRAEQLSDALRRDLDQSA